jgi:hypothetical protein
MAPHDCYKAAGDSEKWVSIAVGEAFHTALQPPERAQP